MKWILTSTYFFPSQKWLTLRNFHTLPKIDMAKHGNLLSIRPPTKKMKKCHFATILLTILIHQRGCPGKSQSLWLDCSKWGYKLHLFNFVSNPPLFLKIWSPLFTDYQITAFYVIELISQLKYYIKTKTNVLYKNHFWL